MRDKEKILKYIGERCRRFRRERGLTMAEAAEQADISVRTLEAYELGEREMSTPTAIKLAEIYRTTLTQLTNYRHALDDLGIEINRRTKE